MEAAGSRAENEAPEVAPRTAHAREPSAHGPGIHYQRRTDRLIARNTAIDIASAKIFYDLGTSTDNSGEIMYRFGVTR